jgi:thioredoxin 1
MRTSRWIIALVIIAVVAVVMIKQSGRRSPSELAAVETRARQHARAVRQAGKRVAPTSELAAGEQAQPARGGEEATAHRAPAPRQSPTSVPARVVAEHGKTAAAASTSPAARSSARPANRASPQAAPRLSEPPQKQPAQEEKTDGPLPGSILATCLKTGLPTMADFGRVWCIPCKQMVPVLKQAARDYSGKANIVFVDLEDYADLGREHRITAMPTQVFFDAAGKEVTRHMGYIGNPDIDAQLAKMGVKK